MRHQAPPQQSADAKFTNSAGTVQVFEAVSQYSGQAAAARAFGLATAGFSCSTGRVQGKPVRVVSRGRGVQRGQSVQAKAWDYADGSTFKATAVAIRVGDRFIGLTFAAKPDAGSNVPLARIIDAAAERATR